jgi:dTDP-4-dehydrorhamnose reductase
MRILVTGGRGLLGQALIPALEGAGHTVVAPGRDTLDLRSLDAIRRSVDEAAALGLDWIVNCAAWTDVDGAETDPDGAFSLNCDAPRVLAEAAAVAGARLLHLSTDYVFSGPHRAQGSARRPWREDDPRAPLSVYGRSKAEGEDAVLATTGSRPVVVRTSWLYGGGGRNFVDTVRQRLAQGEVLRVVEDQVGRPTWTGSLSAMLVALLTVSQSAVPSEVSAALPLGVPQDGGAVLHLADEGVASWHGLALAVAGALGVPAGRVVAVRSADRPALAPRPAWSALDLSKARALLAPTGVEIPRWRASLATYLGTPQVAAP